MAQQYDKAYYDADGLHVTTRVLVSPIAYNTKLVKPEDAPKSFADLLDPKWKGKMVKAHPAYSGTIMNSTFQIARDLGWDYLEKLAKQNVLQVQSATDTPKKIALGERAVMVDGAGYLVIRNKEDGQPVEIVYPTEGTPLAHRPERGVQGRAQPERRAAVPELDARARSPADPGRLGAPVFAAQADRREARRPQARRHQADEGRRRGRGEGRRGDQAALRADLQGVMTIAVSDQPTRMTHGFDFTKLVLYVFAAVLVLLIVLPMSWLVYYGFSDKDGAFTLRNFVTLINDPTLLDPFITTFILAFSTSLICCVVAAPMGWLVARTDMPLRRTVRALVTASFVTPPFLGAIAWELLAAPNSGLLNQLYRTITGAEADEHLFNIYSLTGLIFVISCYTFPFVFVLVANALDNMPGELEDASAILGGGAWTTARRVTIPLALPALVAGALVAFLQAMTLFGSPAILALPAGFHTMTTKIWSLFQYPPKPELAAAASLPLLVLTVMLLRAEHMILGRRSYSVVGGKNSDPRIIRLGRLKWLALAFCFVVLLNPVFLPYVALFNAAFSKVASQVISINNFTLHNIDFVFTELSATRLALYNTFVLGISTATIGTVIAVVISYLTTRQAVTGHRALGFSPPRRSRSPASCSASACSSATRGRPSCSTARCGSC